MTVMLLEWIFTSVFLILVVAALRAALGRRMGAGLRYALWAAVLVRLLVPVQLFTSPVAGTWAAVEKRTEQTVYTAPKPPAGGEGIQGGQDGTTAMDPVSKVPVLPRPPAAPEPPAAPDLTRAPRWLGWVWLGGGGAAALALLASNLRFWLRLRLRRVPLEGTGCPLPVYEAAGLPSPCLFGIIRPAVYVTPEAAADPAMLRHVLAHEHTHYRHGDHVWSLLRCAALAAHWWNPLVWLAAELSRRDGELACDEGALKRLGDGERAAYGNTLLALVTAKPGPGDLFRCATTMAGDKKSLRERITRIAQAPRRWLWAAVAVVLVMALSCACAFGQAEPEDGPDPAPSEGGSASALGDLAADLSLTLDDNGNVSIKGTADGLELGEGTYWQPDGAPAKTLTLRYPPFNDGVEGILYAYWEDGSREAVTINTSMMAALSSYSASGYWIFTVDLSGEEAVVTRMDAQTGTFPEGTETRMYPESISHGEAVRAARIAAKLLTAAEDYYHNLGEKAAPEVELAFDWDGASMMLVNGTNVAIGPDLNRNGVPETITVGRVCSPGEADEARACEDDSRWPLGLGVVVREEDRVLWTGFAANIHAGQNAILLYTEGGRHYLMEFDIHGGFGKGRGDYRIFTLENGGERTVGEDHVSFDYAWVAGAGADVRENFDPEAVAAFVERADGLLADCVVLADTTGSLTKDGPLRVDLTWLEHYAFDFRWNDGLATLENLTRFKLAASAPGYSGDLDRDMRKELVQRTFITDGEGGAVGQRVELWKDEELVWADEGYYAHAGYNAVFLCTLDGKDYLLRYHPYMGQGWCTYSYQLFTLTRGGEERTVRENSVEFDLNFQPEVHQSFDPEAIAAFMDEINGLLANSVQLINTDGDLSDTFQKEGRLYDSLGWLDWWAPAYVRGGRPLAEELRAFQEAMEAQVYAETPQVRTVDELGKHMQLTYRDKYVRFDGLWDELRQPDPEPQVLDLNGDGREEIVFALLEGSGTGVSVSRLYLFDADTLEQYDTAGLTQRLIGQVSSTGDEGYFYLSAPGMERVSIPKSAAQGGPMAEAVALGSVVEYTLKDGVLRCRLGCDAGVLEYCGELQVILTMDRQGRVAAASYEYAAYEQYAAASPAEEARRL